MTKRMRLQAALDIVLSLAAENALEDKYVDTPELRKSQKAQDEALDVVGDLHLLLSGHCSDGAPLVQGSDPGLFQLTEDAEEEPFTISLRELGTVLAALRHWQGAKRRDVESIATDDGMFERLSDAEIDDFCMRLNGSSIIEDESENE